MCKASINAVPWKGAVLCVALLFRWKVSSIFYTVRKGSGFRDGILREI